MEMNTLIALCGFALASSITPGPNNLMLLASGANFGARRTVPHALGVALGFVGMTIGIGIGVMNLLQSVPWGFAALRWISVAFLVFLAWKIANAAPPAEGENAGKPFTFLQAAAFQWVNPKALFMALTAITVYAPSESLGAIVAVAVTFSSVNFPSILTWVCLGQIMRRVLTNHRRLRLFNWTMAALLVASLAMILGPGSSG